MKGKILVSFFVCLSAFFFTEHINAQMVVEDPLNAGINATIQTLNESANAINTFMAQSKLLEMSSSGLQQLATIKDIAKLIDDLACITSEFNYAINLNNKYNCVKFLDYRLVNINLNYSTELLTGVVLSKNLFTMTSSDRISNLNKIKEVLEKTIKEMADINTSIRGSVIRDSYNKFIKKAYTPAVERTITYRRYQNR